MDVVGVKGVLCVDVKDWDYTTLQDWVFYIMDEAESLGADIVFLEDVSSFLLLRVVKEVYYGWGCYRGGERQSGFLGTYVDMLSYEDGAWRLLSRG